MYIITMAFAETTPSFSFVNYQGIGGVTSVPIDLFRTSIEEAIEFLKSFKNRVNENLDILSEIQKNKNDGKQFITNPSPVEIQAIRQEELRARIVFETLQKELQRWLLGNGGISLTK